MEGLQEGKSVKSPEEELLNRMTAEEKTAQLFYITPDALCGVSGATRAGDTLKQSYEQYPVGGLIFFGNNIVSEGQIREMTSGLRETGINRIGVSPFLGIDEEGGTVTRIAGKEGFPVEDVGDMYLIGETGDAGKAREAGSTLGAYLSDYGFDMDFAPDADVLVNPAADYRRWYAGRSVRSRDEPDAASGAGISGNHHNGRPEYGGDHRELYHRGRRSTGNIGGSGHAPDAGRFPESLSGSAECGE